MKRSTSSKYGLVNSLENTIAELQKKVCGLLRTEPQPFNLILEGTFADEMHSSYLQLVRLDVPKGVSIISEPERPVIAPILLSGGQIKINRYSDYPVFLLHAQTEDFITLHQPASCDGTYNLSLPITNQPAVNLFTPDLGVDTCFFACTRDGRIFVNGNYLSKSPELVSQQNIISSLGKIKIAFDSKFSATGMVNDLIALQKALSS